MANIFLFPGQGSQYPGMGKDLHQHFDCVKQLFRDASDISSMDLKHRLFDGTESELKQTKLTQVGITLLNLSVASILRDAGIAASATAGFSLGEYSALWYAGVFDTETVFRAVVQRGTLMDECIQRITTTEKDYAMQAIIGLSGHEVESIVLPLQELGEQIYIANYNAPKQIVLSGDRSSLAKAEKSLKEAGAFKLVYLKVSGPFHSPLMQSAADHFSEFLHTVSFQNSRIPIYSNVSGCKVAENTTPKEWQQCLLDQIHKPVLWTAIEESLLQDGYHSPLEVGTGSVLSSLWKQFLRKEPCQPIGTLAQIRELIA